MAKKLAIVTTHPIQYNAPWFKLLQERGIVAPKVFYTWSQTQAGKKFDPGFNKVVEWDIPLLEGYEFTFVNNTSTNPGSNHKKGIVNPTLISEIEDWKPDAILVFGWNFVSHLQCLQYFHKKIPVLFRGDSTLLRKQSPLIKVIRYAYLKWVYSFVDIALYVGEENKRYFKNFGLKNNQLVFAPHAIDNKRFSDEDGAFAAKAVEWKKELGINSDTVTILYAGKLEPVKDPLVLIEFAKKFTNAPVHFIIAGNGQLQNAVRAAAHDLENITFIDFQNQQVMPILYRLADFFILTSKSETWGLCINEAMVCGNTILVRDTCACATDLVKHGKNGFIFSANNLEVLFNQCMGVLNNKAALNSMGEASKQIIKPYSFHNIAVAIENCL